MAPVPTATSTLLSPAELSYLHTSLSYVPPIRPDARRPTQFRPLTAELDILPSTHGSSRVVWPDGGECIVGVKAEVEKTTSASTADDDDHTTVQKRRPNITSRVEVSVEVAGARDDDPLAVFLASSVADTLGQKLTGRLDIGERWHWKLYIDILLLTPPISHPATLLSLAVNLALRATSLPRLVSQAEEDPLFDDDWDASLPLYPAASAAVGDVPAITLLVTAVGENVFFDPTREEIAVADCVLAVSVDFDGRVVGLRTLESGSMGEGGVGRRVVKRVVEQCGPVGSEVFQALEAIVKEGL